MSFEMDNFDTKTISLSRQRNLRTGKSAFSSDLQKFMDRFYSGFEKKERKLHRIGSSSSIRDRQSLFEVWETASEFIIRLKGIKERDLKFEIIGSDLHIKSLKEPSRPAAYKSCSAFAKFLSERTTKTFARRIRLPDYINKDTISLRAETGALCIVMPKKFAAAVNG